MISKLVFRAMVLGAVACAFSATGFAANVQNGHGQGITDSTTEVNGAKHEAVRSNWLDRTDIAIGVQTGGSSDSHKGMFPSDYNNNFYNTKSDYGNITKAYIETLQPITHYDENSKSVLFVQGGIGKGGQEDQASYFSGGNGEIGIHTIQLLKKANNGIDLKNIIILNHWELLLM